VLEDSTDFNSTSTVDGKTEYALHLNKEAAKIELTPNKLPRG
jgi:hypothetical protein